MQKRCSIVATAALLRSRRHHHGVVTAAGKWMAAEDASEGHPSTTQSAIALDGFHGIFGASRYVAAGRRQHGRDGPLVGSQQLQRDEFGEIAHGGYRALAPAILDCAGPRLV